MHKVHYSMQSTKFNKIQHLQFYIIADEISCTHCKSSEGIQSDIITINGQHTYVIILVPTHAKVSSLLPIPN